MAEQNLKSDKSTNPKMSRKSNSPESQDAAEHEAVVEFLREASMPYVSGGDAGKPIQPESFTSDAEIKQKNPCVKNISKLPEDGIIENIEIIDNYFDVESFTANKPSSEIVHPETVEKSTTRKMSRKSNFPGSRYAAEHETVVELLREASMPFVSDDDAGKPIRPESFTSDAEIKQKNPCVKNISKLPKARIIEHIKIIDDYFDVKRFPANKPSSEIVHPERVVKSDINIATQKCLWCDGLQFNCDCNFQITYMSKIAEENSVKLTEDSISAMEKNLNSLKIKNPSDALKIPTVTVTPPKECVAIDSYFSLMNKSPTHKSSTESSKIFTKLDCNVREEVQSPPELDSTVVSDASSESIIVLNEGDPDKRRSSDTEFNCEHYEIDSNIKLKMEGANATSTNSSRVDRKRSKSTSEYGHKDKQLEKKYI